MYLIETYNKSVEVKTFLDLKDASIKYFQEVNSLFKNQNPIVFYDAETGTAIYTIHIDNDGNYKHSDPISIRKNEKIYAKDLQNNGFFKFNTLDSESSLIKYIQSFVFYDQKNKNSCLVSLKMICI